MICKACGKDNKGKNKFCTHCGTPLTENDQPNTGDTENPRKFGFGELKLNFITPGNAFAAAFVLIEWLPYLVCALIMYSTKMPLASFVPMLCLACGYLLAGLVLFAASKSLSGRQQLSRVIFLLSLLAANRTVFSLLTDRMNGLYPVQTAIWFGSAVTAGIVTAMLMVSPLGHIFSEKVKCRQRGKFISFFYAALGLALPVLLSVIWEFTPFADTVSFMNTSSLKLTGVLIEAGFFTLAVNHLLKKQGQEIITSELGSRAALISGAVLAAASLVVGIVGSSAVSVADTALLDVAGYTAQGRQQLADGNMNAAIESLERAAEHTEAWVAVSQGSGYSIPDKYSDDNMLLYLSYLNGSADSVREYLVKYFDEDDIYLFGPLMLTKYGEREELSENEQAHRSEILSLCIAQECFTYEYPSLEEITAKPENIEAALDIGDKSYDIEVIRALADVQRGDYTPSTVIDVMLDSADAHPQDITAQYMAAVIGSQNKWDGASHYGRTSEAALRFDRLWQEQFGADADDDTIVNVRSQLAEMILNVNEYEKARPMLEELVKAYPLNKAVKQDLSECYINLNDNDKSFALAEDMYKQWPDDVTVIRSYFLSALKRGKNKEAIEAASRLADIVKQDPTDGDLLLFNCASYLGMRDGSVGFSYMLFTQDESDENVKQIMQNKFLGDYVAAIFWTEQRNDHEKALGYVESALSQQPGSGRLWYLKGLIHFNMKDFEKSEEALLYADKLSPNDASVLYALANTYDGMERYQEAYDLCRRVVDMYPNGADHDEDKYGVAPHAKNLMNSLKSYVKEGQ